MKYKFSAEQYAEIKSAQKANRDKQIEKRLKVLALRCEGKSLEEIANQIWPGSYDAEKTQTALSRTLNITAYDGDLLVGCLRILSDGYYFGTITELLILPEYQRKGIGSALLELAKKNTPTMLYFGAQPGVESFYEKNGCQKGLQSNTIAKKRQ